MIFSRFPRFSLIQNKGENHQYLCEISEKRDDTRGRGFSLHLRGKREKREKPTRVFHPEDGPADIAARLDKFGSTWSAARGQQWSAGNDWKIIGNCGKCGQRIVAHWYNSAHLERVVCAMFTLAHEAHQLDCPERSPGTLTLDGSKTRDRVGILESYALAG